MSATFQEIFRAGHDPSRAKFLSRVFGIFSEEIVRIWANHDGASYAELVPGARPTLKALGETRGHTLDFALRHKATGQVFVAEMKCEIEFQNFRYFVLDRAGQLDHHAKEAFRAFLAAAGDAPRPRAFVKGREVIYDGAILIWGSVTEAGRKAVMEHAGLHDVLSVEQICQDLVSWRSRRYAELLEKRLRWSRELFEGLAAAAGPSPNATMRTIGQ